MFFSIYGRTTLNTIIRCILYLKYREIENVPAPFACTTRSGILSLAKCDISSR